MGILGVLPGHTEVECFGFLFFVVLAQILHPLGMNSFGMKGAEKKPS